MSIQIGFGQRIETTLTTNDYYTLGGCIDEKIRSLKIPDVLCNEGLKALTKMQKNKLLELRARLESIGILRHTVDQQSRRTINQRQECRGLFLLNLTDYMEGGCDMDQLLETWSGDPDEEEKAEV